MSSTIPYQERTSAEAVGLAEEEVPVIVLPNGERLEFPGCRAYKMSLSELEEYEGRYEYWYGPTETLIVVADEPRVSGDHELPAPYLMQLVQQIADECGAHFVPFGTVSIWDANAEGVPRVVMRPDQCLYLRPQSARLPDKDGLKLGFHTLPDVVLEVDHTTDIRRGKLHQYALWGFPEVWVEVPEAYTPSRRAGKPRLTIYVLEGSQYREVAASRALAGWTAAEIHRALNERLGWSSETTAALLRVARALTARLGTAGPEGTPRLRMHREEGKRALLCQQAALRFGENVAKDLASLLADVSGENLTHVGGWIVTSHNADELLRRVRENRA
ncbi:MAG: Uma2 family endonuclease [Gemmatimonadetes bacterium]|nr:Uma2 family endonuclease [Gemmatimonadota bacterium]